MHLRHLWEACIGFRVTRWRQLAWSLVTSLWCSIWTGNFPAKRKKFPLQTSQKAQYIRQQNIRYTEKLEKHKTKKGSTKLVSNCPQVNTSHFPCISVSILIPSTRCLASGLSACRDTGHPVLSSLIKASRNSVPEISNKAATLWRDVFPYRITGLAAAPRERLARSARSPLHRRDREHWTALLLKHMIQHQTLYAQLRDSTQHFNSLQSAHYSPIYKWLRWFGVAEHCSHAPTQMKTTVRR